MAEFTGMGFRSWALASAAMVSMALPAYAQESEQHFNIPPQQLTLALNEFGRQSGRDILFSTEVAAGLQSPGVQGSYTPDAALRALLAGTGIEFRTTNEQTFLLEAQNTSPTHLDAEDQAASSKVTEDFIVVTGTRIRGGATPSPTIVIGAETMREEGFTDLGAVIRSIPQNFAGGQNPGVVNGAAGSLANQNLTGGAALNLRGLGPDATLTLLNGRRMAYGGFVQSVDISAIPLEAVDRIEIVADGASAIYGSDAVGGVANVILRRDYDGVALGARYGRATDGGRDTHEYSITAGRTWSSGGLIATYLYGTSDPVFADQRDYTEGMFHPTSIYPGSRVRSGLFSAHQSIGDFVVIGLDALVTDREQTQYQGQPGFYAAGAPETNIYLVSPSLEASLPNDWTLLISGSWGADETHNNFSIVTPTSISPRGTLYRNRNRAYEIGAEGPLFALAGGDARLALGAGYRTNEFRQLNLISGLVSVDSDESSRFAYAEISLPLISPDQDIWGARRLVLTGAVRGEDYDSFGSVTTPKLGVIYGPNADVSLRASWGQSFKTPTLHQRNQALFAYLYPATFLGGTGYDSAATVLMTYGGNPDLGPERAETWSASLVAHPEALPELQLELTAFAIDYSGRVRFPLNIPQALASPIYAQFINASPSGAELANILSNFSFINQSGAAYDPANVVAIAYNQNVNVARQEITGFDLSGSYRIDVWAGELALRGSVSWLDSTQQLLDSQPATALAGTLFNPARLSARFGVVWSEGGFTASTFLNHTEGVTDTVTDVKSGAFTTLDATISYDTGDRDDALSGLRFELSAQNLFNQTPPLYTAALGTTVPYDSTNYSAVGRFLSISISKRW